MAKLFKDLVSEVEKPKNFNKFVHDLHKVEELPDISQDEANFTPGSVSKAKEPKGKPLFHVKESDAFHQYRDQAYSLMDELDELVTTLIFAGNEGEVKYVAENLATIRDHLIGASVDVQSDDSTVEDVGEPAPTYESGTLTLKDGSQVELDEAQAAAINALFLTPRSKIMLEKRMLDDVKSFDAVVRLAEENCKKCKDCGKMVKDGKCDCK